MPLSAHLTLGVPSGLAPATQRGSPHPTLVAHLEKLGHTVVLDPAA